MSGKSIRLVIADDHPLVLHGLVSLLRSEPGFKVLAACTNGATALEAIRTHSPDIALLDLRLPKMTGLEVLEKISTCPTRIVILTAFVEDRDLLVAANCGVSGIIMKDSASNVLVRCLHTVQAGGRFMPRALMQRLLNQQKAAASVHRLLTSRERDVVRLVTAGLSNKRVAAILKISEGTTKLHLHNVYRKIGVSGRFALMSLAQHLGDAFGPKSPSEPPRQRISTESLH